MYQRVLITAMSLTIGLYGSIRLSDSRISGMACWGLMYPRWSFVEGTYRAMEEGMPEISPEELAAVDAEQIVIRWKLLELLSE